MAIIRPVTKTLISSPDWGIPITDAVNANTNAIAANAPTVWTALALVNGWTNPGGYVTQCRKIGDLVQIRGRLTGGPMLATMFTLPVGFRPIMPCEFAVGSADAGGNWQLGILQIATDGTVTPRMGTNIAQTCNVLSFSNLAA